MKNFSVHTRLTIKNTGEGFDELLGLFKKIGGLHPTPFQSLIPMPEEIWDTEATSFDVISKGDELGFLFSQEILWDKSNYGISRSMSLEEIAKYKSPNPIKDNLLERYGVNNWRQWALKNWGTPWEARNVSIKYHTKKEVLISFTTDEQSPLSVIEVISDRFPRITYAYDIYCYDHDNLTTHAGGYDPGGGRIYLEDIASILTERYEYLAVVPSDNFLKFCKSFSKFPIGGPILRSYDPSIQNDLSSIILNALTIEKE